MFEIATHMNHKTPNTKSITPANPPNTPPTIPPTFFPVPLVVLTAGWFVCSDAGRTVLTIYCVDTCPLFGFVTTSTLVVADGSVGREEEEVKVLLHELLRNVVVCVVRTSIVDVPRVVSVVVPPT